MSEASEHGVQLEVIPGSNLDLCGRETDPRVPTKVLDEAATVSHGAPAERGSHSGKSPKSHIDGVAASTVCHSTVDSVSQHC